MAETPTTASRTPNNNPSQRRCNKWDDDVKVSDSGEAAARRVVMSAPVTLCRRAYLRH